MKEKLWQEGTDIQFCGGNCTEIHWGKKCEYNKSQKRMNTFTHMHTNIRIGPSVIVDIARQQSHRKESRVLSNVPNHSCQPQLYLSSFLGCQHIHSSREVQEHAHAHVHAHWTQCVYAAGVSSRCKISTDADGSGAKLIIVNMTLHSSSIYNNQFSLKFSSILQHQSWF